METYQSDTSGKDVNHAIQLGYGYIRHGGYLYRVKRSTFNGYTGVFIFLECGGYVGEVKQDKEGFNLYPTGKSIYKQDDPVWLNCKRALKKGRKCMFSKPAVWCVYDKDKKRFINGFESYSEQETRKLAKGSISMRGKDVRRIPEYQIL